MQQQNLFFVALLLLGAANATRTRSSFMGGLKPSGDKATDEADAVAIELIENLEKQHAEDSKQMSAVAGIEEKQTKAEESDSKQMMEDANAIEKVDQTDKGQQKTNEEQDVLKLKEVAAKEELDAVHGEEDAKRMRADAEKIGTEAEKDLKAEETDEKTLEDAEKSEKKSPAVVAAALKTTVQGRCGPQTKIHLPIGEDAVGETTWSDPFAPNKKHPIGRYDVKTAKICGPGTFTFSPTSCGRMDYKPDIFTVSTSESGDCQVVDLKWCGIGGLGCMEVDC